MPFRRRRFRRKFRKSKRRMIRRYLKKKSKSGNLTVTKLKLIYTLTTSAGGVLDSYNAIRDPSSTYDWSSYGNLYDNYRVFAVKWQFIPAFPNNISSSTTFQPFYTCIDYDSTDNSFVTNEAEILHYENAKVYNLYRPFKKYFKVPKMYSYSPSSGTGVVLPGGFMDIAAPCSSGVVAYYASSLTPSVAYGTIVLTYYTGFKNRR